MVDEEYDYERLLMNLGANNEKDIQFVREWFFENRDAVGAILEGFVMVILNETTETVTRIMARLGVIGFATVVRTIRFEDYKS